MQKVMLTGFARLYKGLTDEYKSKKPEEYKLCILILEYKALTNGFYVSRVCRATKDGTKVHIKAITSDKQAERKVKELKEKQMLIKQN